MSQNKASKQVCPECGADMTDLDPVGHANSHYPDYLDPRIASPTAIKRKAQLLAGGVSASDYRKGEGG